MSHKRLILVLAVVLVAVAVLAGVALASRGSAPSPAVDQQLREAVARYEAARKPVRPPQLYGKTLTLSRCIRVMRVYERGVKATGAGEAVKYAADYSHLKVLRWDEAAVQRSRGANALPVAWTGRIAYWHSPRGKGDTYTVRAAVYTTMVSAIWDPVGERLTQVQRRDESSADIRDYTIQRLGGVWKVTQATPWDTDGYYMYFEDGKVQKMVP